MSLKTLCASIVSLVLVVITVGQLPAQTTNESEPSTQVVDTRILSFPKDRSLGELEQCPVRDLKAKDFPDQFDRYKSRKDFVKLGPAQGDVRVPINSVIKLDLSDNACKDLSPISRLPNDAIHFIESNSRNLADDQFRHIGTQTDLRCIQIAACETTDAAVEHLKDCKKLIFVEWSNYIGPTKSKFGLSDHGVSILAKCPQLRTLRLREQPIGDKACEAIGECNTLRFLDLDSTNVTGEGLNHLLFLTDLEHLSLGVLDRGAPITNDDLKIIGQMEQLDALDLSATKVTGEGLVHLKSLKRLEHLTLDELVIQDDHLEFLKPLQALRTLRIYRKNDRYLGDEAAKWISELPNLERVTTRWDLTEVGHKHLSKLKKFTKFSLRGTINLKEAESLSKMSGLKRLEFQHCEIAEEAFEHLSKLDSLESLSIYSCHLVQAHLESIGQMTNLKSLSIKDEIDEPSFDLVIDCLDNLKALESLAISLDDIRARSWQCLSNLENLDNLEISSRRTPIAASILAHLPPSIKRISFKNTLIGNSDIASLQQAKNLSSVSLKCVVTSKGVSEFSNLPSLKHLQLTSPYFEKENIEKLLANSTIPKLRIYEADPRDSIFKNKDGHLQLGSGKTRAVHDKMQNQPAPPLTTKAHLNAADKFKLADLKGKVVIVEFFRTRSETFEAELPYMKALYAKCQPRGLEIVSIHITRQAEEMHGFAVRNGMRWPCLADDANITIADWNVETMPCYFILDRDGKIKYANIHRSELERVVENLIGS